MTYVQGQGSPSKGPYDTRVALMFEQDGNKMHPTELNNCPDSQEGSINDGGERNKGEM